MATRGGAGNTTVSHSGSGPININTGSGDSFHGTISGGSGHVQYIANHQYIQTVGGGADQDRLDREFRDALYLTSPEIERRTLLKVKGSQLVGTCEWILSHQRFVAWLRQEKQRLLWIHGGAGRGKTMLSIFISTMLEGKAKTIYFFCSGDADKRRSATAVLRGLMWHLTRICPGLTRVLRGTLGPDLDAALSSRATLWAAFSGLIEAMGSEQLYCVIDGLEECDRNSENWLAEMFTTLHESPVANTFKTILLSRHLAGLWGSNQICLDYEDISVQSVRYYTMMKTRELASRFDFDGETLHSIRNTLCERSRGNFLWIGFVMVTLSEQRDMEEILHTLNRLPAGLGALYDHMFHNMEFSQGAMVLRILSCVSLACRCLTLDELTYVVASWPRDGPSVERELVRDLIRYCRPSLQLARQTVTLTHGSLRDYANSYDSPDGSRLLPERVHLRLAWACIDALAQQGQRSPLAQYAAEYWPSHARRSSTFAKELISHPSLFFNASSELRTSWWVGPSSPKMIPKERDIPALHLACLLGIEPWANDIIERHEELRIRFGGSTDSVHKQDHEGRTALHFAAVEGHVAIARLLLRRGANVHVENEHRQTALHLATKAGFVVMAKLLLDHGAHVDTTDETGWTALYWAVNAGQETVVRVLLNHAANVNAQDEHRQTALHLATKAGFVEMAKLLLDHEAHVDTTDETGWTALHWAVNAGQEAVVRVLLDHEANVDAQDYSEAHRSPLDLATMRDAETMVDLLLGH